MDLCNKLLSKAPISWTDLQKQLMIVLQSRGGTAVGLASAGAVSAAAGSTSTISASATSLSVNKLLVKQCTDLLVKHIKNLNQNQVIEQLEKFVLTTPVLQFYKVPNEEDPTTTNVFLSADDFYFEVAINISGEIMDVKFSMFSETSKSSSTLKEIIWSWNWDALSRHIDGIRSNYIINSTDHNLRSRAYKSIQHLEKDLATLFQIQTKYLSKNLKILGNAGAVGANKSSSNFLLLDRLVNLSPIGLFKRSELGEPLRLYFYSSPLDIIAHFNQLRRQVETGGSFKKLVASTLNTMSVEQLVQLGVGSYLCITLHSLAPLKSAVAGQESTEPVAKYRLPSASSIVLSESDEKSWHELLAPFFNTNSPLSHKTLNSLFANKSNANDTELPGTFLLTLSKPVVMCLSTLEDLQSQLGVKTVQIDRSVGQQPFFELLAKTLLSNQTLNDSYAVELPDEVQIYYITEQNQPDCLGVVVDRLLFTHPQQIPAVLHTLRKQQLFNELLVSCMRKPCSGAFNYYNAARPGQTSPMRVRILEVCLLEPFRLSVIMQHPWLTCYTVVEVDVNEGVVQTVFRDHPGLYDKNLVSEILRRCHSIPVTIRALFMAFKQQQQQQQQKLGGLGGSHGDSNGGASGSGSSNREDQNGGNGSGRNHRSSSSDDGNNNMDFQDSSMNNQMQVDGAEEMHVTPRSLYACNDFNGNPITPNRLTPSRGDSYNPSGSGSVSVSFNFSNYPYHAGSDAKKVAKELKAELGIRKRGESGSSTGSEESSGESSSGKKARAKHDGVGVRSEATPSGKLKGGSSGALKSGKGSVASPQPGCLANTSLVSSSNKKRKASTSSSRSVSPSLTPASSSSNAANNTQPPSAKRKMVNQSTAPGTNDLKRHQSFLDDSSGNESSSSSSTKNPASAPSKKLKLKTSHSSADLGSSAAGQQSSGKSTNENKQQKVPGIKSASGNQQNSPSSVLSATKLNANSKDGKLVAKAGKLDCSNPAGATAGAKKLSSTSASTPKSNVTPGNAKDGLKVKVSSKDAGSLSNKIQRSISTSSSPANVTSLSNKSNFLHNLSATEVQLKQPSSSANSPLVNASSSSISTPSSSIQHVQLKGEQANALSQNRTPSPSLSSMSSMSSWSAQMTTPSPGALDAGNDASSTASSSESNADANAAVSSATTASKTGADSAKSQKLKQRQAGETLLNKLTSLKSGTPPSATAFALGLGPGMASFKASNFKIPHKSKTNSESSSTGETTNDDELAMNSKTPLSSSSPITVAKDSAAAAAASKINSPNKSQAVDLTKPTGSAPVSSFAANKPNVRTSMPPPLIAPQSQPLQSPRNNNMSPKWQASYSSTGSSTSGGNISPRYNYNDSSSANNAASVGAAQAPGSAPIGKNSSVINPPKYPNKSQQPSQPQRNIPAQSAQTPQSTQPGNRPVTPIPLQFANAAGGSISPANSNLRANNYYYSNPAAAAKAGGPATPSALPPPLMSPSFASSKPAIPPLMSFAPTALISPSSREKDMMMTPKSPSPPSTSPTGLDSSALKANIEVIHIPTEPAVNSKQHQNATNSVLNSSTSSSSEVNSGPPDSPTGETTTIFIPKLIPLERNPSNDPKSGESSKPPPAIVTKTIPTVAPPKPIGPPRMKAVDIASPDAPPADEEDDDNLVIDLISHSAPNASAPAATVNIPTTPTEMAPPTVTAVDQTDKAAGKAPSPVQQLVTSSLQRSSSEAGSALASSSAPLAPTVTSTFTTRQLSESNYQNEILSPSATATSSSMAASTALASVIARSPTQKPTTKSPCIIEEDLLNDAVTG